MNDLAKFQVSAVSRASSLTAIPSPSRLVRLGDTSRCGTASRTGNAAPRLLAAQDVRGKGREATPRRPYNHG